MVRRAWSVTSVRLAWVKLDEGAPGGLAAADEGQWKAMCWWLRATSSKTE